MMASIFMSVVLLVCATSVVSGQGGSSKLHDLIRKSLLSSKHRLEETADLDGCIGKQTVILPVPVDLKNLSISSVWMDGFLHFEVDDISGRGKKVVLLLRFPEIMASAHIAPNLENGTMLMMDFANHRLSIEIDLRYTANGSHVIVAGHRILPRKDGQTEKPVGSEFAKRLRQFVELRIANCSSIFAREVTSHLRVLFRSVPKAVILSGSALPRSARKPRQTTRDLNRVVDRFLNSVDEELYERLSSLRLRSFRLRFSRLQFGGPDAGGSSGSGRFYSGRLRNAHRLRRYRNVRDYTRNGRWYVRVALRVPALDVRYRGRMYERGGDRESDEVTGRVRTVRMLWLMSQDSPSTGATKVENVRVSMVSRPRFDEPDFGDLQYAWDRLERRVERRVRELVRRLLQVRVETVLRDLVEGEGDEDAGSRRQKSRGGGRGRGGGRQLFKL